MSLYKFIEKEFFDEFFLTGSLRLGTLEDFKKTEEHGGHRGDVSEGKHNVYRHVDDKLILTADTLPSEPLISSSIHMDPASNQDSVTLSNVLFIDERNSQDVLTFCTSRVYSTHLFSEWNQKESLNYCYEIFDIKGFITAISNALSARSKGNKFKACDLVAYTNKNIDYRSKYSKVHPCFLKDNDYAWQHEVRMVWAFDDIHKKQDVIIMNVPEAIKFCRKHAYIERGEIKYLSSFKKYFK
ncbi:hypothetical protein WFP14_12230 [Yersinia proxima]|uniref:Uncharacterized protein n=1 Tax=Yersinia proxima TaxID=2890316 RepID=A0ABW9EZF0_9GAMM